MQSQVILSSVQSPPVESINLLKSGKQPARQYQRPPKDSSRACTRCGNIGHKPSQCKFLKAKYHGCGKIGHLKKVYRSSNTQETVKTVEVRILQHRNSCYNLYNLEDAALPKSTENRFKVTLTVEGKSVQMDIDKGASLSLISEQTYLELWPLATLQQTTIQLKAYTGTPVN